MRKADFITGIILCIISIFFIVEALKMPEDPAFGIYGHPGLSPIFFASMLFILSFYLILRSKIKFSEIKNDIILLKNFKFSKEIKNLIIAISFIIIYVSFLRKVSFFILTFLFIFLFSFFYYRKKPHILLIISLVATTIIILVFSRLFFIPMP